MERAASHINSAHLPTLIEGVEYLIRAMPDAKDWSILLEYPIPLVGKRIDAVVLARNLVIVLESKSGANSTSAARQVDDYAVNLACFHEETRGRTVVPLVVTDAPVATNSSSTTFDALIEECQTSSAARLGLTLEATCRIHVREDQPTIDPEIWDRARFWPIPPIIDAAVALYSGMNVFEIGHACAAREDLESTTDVLVRAVLQARELREKVICFVTGVPGAGKTLVGLNTVHREEIKNFSAFLSGNGPLVKVIQEALVRDIVERFRFQRPRVSRRQAEIEIQTFIHNVHRFVDQYFGNGHREPVQRVIVFDEAQRAWDEEQNERAKRARVSEPQMMLEVIDRHTDWAVIVALIGAGQEINRGEAGLAEWGRALARFPDWKVYASPTTLDQDNKSSGFRLFESEGNRHLERIFPSEALHLKVCTRSIRAQRISDWVDAVLLGQHDKAAAIANSLESKPLLTRTLDRAKEWLHGSRRGQTRAGLVASSSANRLRADGIEPTFDFHKRFDWEHWFLDNSDCSDSGCAHRYCNDVRASSRLEVAATQFEIQGLELDWIGVCWGKDLTWDGEKWVCRRFDNKKWKQINSNDNRRRAYLVNAYRVFNDSRAAGDGDICAQAG